jgi:hypothetical protein
MCGGLRILREIPSHLGKNTESSSHRGLLVARRDHHGPQDDAMLILHDDAKHCNLRAACSFGNYLFFRLANGVNSLLKRWMFIRFKCCASMVEFLMYARSSFVAAYDLMKVAFLCS